MKSIALVIGINDYDSFDALSAAVNDANAISQKLTALKFKVELCLNIKYDDYLIKFGEFINEIQNGYDVALLYFAGHGAMINNSDCLFLLDTPDISAHGGIPSKGKSIVVDDVCKVMRGVGDQINIVIVDACRTEKSRGVNLPISDFGRNIKLPYQTFIAYSTSPGCPAKDGNIHSPYTGTLLKYIDIEHLQIELMFKEVRKELFKGIGNQMPWEHSSLIEHFAFNHGQCNPYYGALYCQQAYEDATFIASSAEVMAIIEDFKSCNVYRQRDALHKIRRIKNNLNKDEKFVIGRNILQAAVGGCFDCQNEISVSRLLLYQEGKENHVLNGILYEMYFDHHNQIRESGIKYDDLNKIHLLASFKDFASSFDFIRDALFVHKEHFNYIPGETFTHTIYIDIEDKGEQTLVGKNIWEVKGIKYKDNKIILPFYGNLIKGDFLLRLSDTIQVPSVLIKTFFSPAQISSEEYLKNSLFT